MAVIAVLDNTTELAQEIETRTALLQAIKEGNLPSYIETVYGVRVEPEVPTLVVEPQADPVPVAVVPAAVVAPAAPAVPTPPQV